jgi:ubiquinone/menaquinone biosynthesis C-methylase UbiE
LSDSDKLFTGSIATIYDRYLVPLIFEQYARDMAERAASLAPDSILEIASGSGVVTRAVAEVLRSDTRYVATDLNPPMLEQAAKAQSDPERIEWQPADALHLPFGDETFDLALCQFGVMFFPDRVRAYSETRRVLRSGGAFVFSMWDRIEENDFAQVVTQSLAATFPRDPPDFLARVPHGHYDIDLFRTELRTAGFTDVTIESLEAISSAENAMIPAVAYCQGTPLRNEIETQTTSTLEEATEQASNAIAERFGEGSVEGRIRAFVITASALATNVGDVEGEAESSLSRT